MPNIRYAGAEPSTEAFGKTFIAGEWTDDAGLDPEAVTILRTNPQFMVTDDKVAKGAPPSPEVGRVETAKPSGVGDAAETPAA